MDNYRSVMSQSVQINPQQVWNNYIQDQLQWLRSSYQKTHVDNHAYKLNKVRQLFQQLKRKSKLYKNSKYFDHFAKLQQAKWYRMTRKFDNESYYQSRIYYFQEMLYKNQKLFIQFLSRQRYAFKYIAKHIIREINNQPLSFSFDVERGIYYGKEGYHFTNKLIYFMFVRDVANAIIELQRHHIFHADITLRNILLFNCTHDQLSNIKELANASQTIKFKLIDFGDAFFMDGFHYAETRQLLELKKQKHSGIFLSIITYQNKLEQFLDKQSYKKFHSSNFYDVLGQIQSQNQKQPKFKIDYSVGELVGKLIKEQKYDEIIIQMNKLIQKEVELICQLNK